MLLSFIYGNAVKSRSYLFFLLQAPDDTKCYEGVLALIASSFDRVEFVIFKQVM